jgi:hypothetical protein
MTNHKGIQFFLGSNTKRGFVPLFDQLRDPVDGASLYILKGGPGSGKSSLMRRIGKTLEENGHFVEYTPCASDPQSLDAIYDHDAKIAMIDGTAPHTLDPYYPGAYDNIINLGEAWDQKALSNNRARIMELSSRISQCHSMATSCITAAAALLDSNKAIAKAYVDQDAVHAFMNQLMKEVGVADTGTEHKRLLSAVSVGKTVFFDDTLTTLCPTLYVISDEWGAASDVLLTRLREYASSAKLDFITCYCSIHVPEKIDHLLFPSVGLGITTANSFHTTGSQTGIPVLELMKTIDQTLQDSMTKHLVTAKHLIQTAGEHVERAKMLHDELEAFYIAAMDFSKVEEVYNTLMNDILHRDE